MNTAAPRALHTAALQVAEKAYSPYSRFCVGAAVQTRSGEIFASANMENASFGITACAEVGAFQACSAAGLLGEVTQLVIVGGPRGSAVADGPAVMPCGRCRQIIYEAACLSGQREMEVWCGDLSGQTIRRFTISELLPHGFGPEALP